MFQRRERKQQSFLWSRSLFCACSLCHAAALQFHQQIPDINHEITNIPNDTLALNESSSFFLRN